MDRRKNAEPYKKGETPSPRSEYFGKSYGEGQREVKKAKSEALKKKKGGHKQGEREVASKKAGFYVQGHKNYGDVYEA